MPRRRALTEAQLEALFTLPTTEARLIRHRTLNGADLAAAAPTSSATPCSFARSATPADCCGPARLSPSRRCASSQSSSTSASACSTVRSAACSAAPKRGRRTPYLRGARAINDQVRLPARLGGALIAAKEGDADLDEAVADSVGWEKLAASIAETERLACPGRHGMVLHFTVAVAAHNEGLGSFW